MTRYLRRFVCLFILWPGLVGCMALLEQDFRKATLISEIELGSSRTYTQTLTPPLGSASLIIAVPNYRCAALEDGLISFTVRKDGRPVLSERKRLSEFTWSYGEGSCDAYGYIRGNKSLDINDDKVSLTFEIDISQVRSTPRRGASVWLVYGDRVPTATIFGEKR